MTIEEKAKAYDEVLEKVKPLYKQAKEDNCPIWSTYEYLFPQLTESEEERIRKAIVGLIEELQRSDKNFAGVKLTDMLTYLEKQKEQKPILDFKASNWYVSKVDGKIHDMDDSNPNKKYYSGVDDTLSNIAGILHGVYSEEKLKEQEPAEYERPLLSKFEQAVYDCAWGKVTCKPEGETQEEYAKRWAEHLLMIIRDWADDYIDTQIVSAERKAYDKGKADAEKPAEWSDTNELVFKDICKHLKEEGYNGWIVLLEALRNGEFQSKQKWSEEDEIRKESCMLYLANTRDVIEFSQHIGDNARKSGKKEIQKDIDWLKNLRPSWKPTKEQMQYLLAVINDPNNIGAESCYLTLKSLYDDLKKFQP